MASDSAHRNGQPPKHGQASGPHAFVWLPVAGVMFLAFVVSIPTRALAVQCLGLALFALLVFLIIRRTAAWDVLAGLRSRARMAICLIVSGYALFFGWYLSQYHFVPTWDSIGYWSQTLRFNQNLSQSVHGAMISMLKTVNESDYNDILSWVMSAPVAIFPEWIQTFYAEAMLISIPTALLVAATVTARIRSFGIGVDPDWALPALFVLSLSSWAFLRPVFTGYLDGPAALLYVAVMTAFFDDRFPEIRSMQVFAGIGLAGTFLLRRWYIYGVLGLVVAAALYWLAGIGLHALTASVRRALASLLVAGVSALALVLLFPGFIRHSLTGGQTVAYKSWTYTFSYLVKITDVCSMIGWLWFVLAAFAMIMHAVLNRGRRSSLSRFWLFEAAMVICAVVALALFWQVQDLSPQHYYIFLFAVQMMLYTPVFCVISEIGTTWLRRSASAVLAMIAVLGLAHGFVVPANSTVGAVLNRTVGETMSPPTRQSNFDAKHALVDYLSGEAGGKTVYFAAASIDLNGTMPYGACLPQCASTAFSTASADVDSRDGFNTSFFDSEYVVTSNPVSLHVPAEREQVVVNLNSLVQDSGGYIGMHYQKVQSFDFGDSTTVDVYKKISDFSRDDVKQLEQLFDGIYPNLPELFHDRFEKYLANMNG